MKNQIVNLGDQISRNRDLKLLPGFHEANHFLKKLTRYANSTGVFVGITEGIIRIKPLEDLKIADNDGEFGRKNILLARIRLLEKFPGDLPNMLAYPVDFRRRYYKAQYRSYCIKEFERVLGYAWDIPSNPSKMGEIMSDFAYSIAKDKVSTTSQKPIDIVSTFFDSLFQLYLETQEFVKIQPILDWCLHNGILNCVYNLDEYFYKINKVEEGCYWLDKVIESYISAGIRTDTLVMARNLLKRREGQIYKPRKLKKTFIESTEIIKFDGKFPFEN